MNYRPLGTSEIFVSEIGFGTWGIGGATEGASSYGPTDDLESIRALETAFDNGINFFDTATAYGKAEELIGQTFRGHKRQQIIIATKVGITKHYTQPDFSETNITSTVQNSLKRLQTDYIDLLQLYNPPFNELPIDDILNALGKMKNNGLIRAMGASVKSPDDGLSALSFPGIKILQTNLNMLDQRGIDNGLLERAGNLGVGIIARTPLCFGFLTGKITSLDFDSQDIRSKLPREQLEAWLRAVELFSNINPYPDGHMSQFALRFCLDSPGVSTVISGPVTTEEVLDNVAACRLPPLDQEVIRNIRNIYLDNGQFFVKPAIENKKDQ